LKRPCRICAPPCTAQPLLPPLLALLNPLAVALACDDEPPVAPPEPAGVPPLPLAAVPEPFPPAPLAAAPLVAMPVSADPLSAVAPLVAPALLVVPLMALSLVPLEDPLLRDRGICAVAAVPHA
jgi:hypothetical protein